MFSPLPISGRLVDKFGAMPLCIIGFAISGYYSYQLHTLTYSSNLGDLQWIMIKRAIGLGLAMMPMSTVGMKTIPRYMASQASALNNLLRQISGSFGIAIITYIMQQRQVQHMAWLGNTLKWSSFAAWSTLEKLQIELIHRGLAPLISFNAAKTALAAVLAREATIAGIDDAMLMPALVAFMIIPLSFLMSKNAVSREAVRQSKRFTPPSSLSR